MSKDELNDLEEPREEDPALETAIMAIRKTYEAYKERGIKKPLSAAIYKVWKVVDKNE